MNARFFRRSIALILLLAMLLSMTAGLTACDETAPTVPEGAPVIEWQSEGLFSELPSPITEYGRVVSSTENKLELELYVTQKSDFSAYVQNAVARGYTESVKNSEFFYSAGNSSGYKFSAQYKESQKLIAVTVDASNVTLTAEVNSTAFFGMQYFEVVAVLTARGFTNVVPKVIAVEEDSEHEDYSVESVTYNSLAITPESLIPRSGEIIVKYYKRNITLSVSASDMVGKHHVTAEAILKSAGFANVIRKEVKADANSSLPESANGTVTEITLNGRADFVAGEIFAPNSVITVTYVSLDLTLDNDSANYKYRDPETVEEELCDKGFKNVTVTFTHDYPKNDLITYDGKIAEITANGKPFSAGESISRYADIEIIYYQYNITMEVSSQFIAKNAYYTDAVEYLQELGFTNVTAVKSQQLITGWMHFHGEIYSVTVNNGYLGFSEGQSLPYDTPITIKYYYDPNY